MYRYHYVAFVKKSLENNTGNIYVLSCGAYSITGCVAHLYICPPGSGYHFYGSRYYKLIYHSLNSKSSRESYSIKASNLFLNRIKAGADIFILYATLFSSLNILRDSSDAQNVLSANNSRNSPSSFSMSADFRCNKNSLPRFTSTACSIVLLNLKNANIQDEP